MSKYLITGASGFIGTKLVQELERNGEEIIAVVRNEKSNISEIADREHTKIVVCDMDNIENLCELVKDEHIDACIHLAWEGSTGAERADYSMQLRNVENTLKLVRTMNKMGVKRMIFAGTLAEMDVLHYHGLDGSQPNAVSHYGTAKLSAHYMSKAECANNGIEHIWCYLANTYGEGNQTNNFVNFASKVMLEGKRAAFTSGEQMYDFVYVKDIARAIYAVTKSGKNYTSYYLGSTKQRPLKEYIKMIRDAINPSIELHLGEIPFKGTSLPDEMFSSQKLVEDTGYVPKYTFEETIKPTITWLKEAINL